MLKIKVESLKPGVKLGKDLFSFDSQLLLPVGTVVTQDHLDSLAKRKIEDVYVAEEVHQHRGKEKPFESVYADSLHAIKSFLMEARLGQPLETDEVNLAVDALFNEVFDELNVFKGIRLMKDKDDYLFTHSINVSMLAMLVGRWMKYKDQQIKELGTAGLLHDIGKVFIVDSILNKPGKLTDEEYEEMKKHSTLGFELLSRQGWIDPIVAHAVLYHHERADGSGYPSRIKNYGNNAYAAIIAVCDVFDAITSSRVYSGKRSPFTAADILWEESFGKLDPVITKCFYGKITSSLIGSQVLLSDGQHGEVIFIDAFQPTRPIVKVQDTFVNLALDRSVNIMEVID
ncbi:MAG TPA: HD-GYP domain-containing protein [Syntrophomonadaceae bacterium]|nr:HD-GYP domain-containing protein [Syntrophomonadaceae bacterium]